MSSPRSPATSAELRSNPAVVEAIEVAWRDSEADDPARRHEEGGWIYQNHRTGEICVRRATARGQVHIDLSNPPVVENCVVVGKFHTHPNPTVEGGKRDRARETVTWTNCTVYPTSFALTTVFTFAAQTAGAVAWVAEAVSHYERPNFHSRRHRGGIQLAVNTLKQHIESVL